MRVRRQAISDFTAYSLDDVDAAFRLHPSWTELRYSQRHELLPPMAANTHTQQQGPGSGHPGDGADGGPPPSPGGGIWVTPHPAGRFPGGAVWRISLGCGEEVVYACDYNHRKERCGWGWARARGWGWGGGWGGGCVSGDPHPPRVSTVDSGCF